MWLHSSRTNRRILARIDSLKVRIRRTDVLFRSTFIVSASRQELGAVCVLMSLLNVHGVNCNWWLVWWWSGGKADSNRTLPCGVPDLNTDDIGNCSALASAF